MNTLNTVINYFSQHAWITGMVGVAGTWLFNNVITVFVTSMPAPTRNSSEKYKYWFRVLNTIIGNISRARSTTVENSPNWQAAVDNHIQTLNGTTPTNPPQEGGH